MSILIVTSHFRIDTSSLLESPIDVKMSMLVDIRFPRLWVNAGISKRGQLLEIF